MPLKAVKRLHQASDAIAPALSDSFNNNIKPFLKNALQDKDLLICGEIAEMARMADSIFRNPKVLNLYLSSKDLGRILEQILYDADQLEKSHPTRFTKEIGIIRKDIEAMKNILKAELNKEKRNEGRKLLKEIITQAGALVANFLPILFPLF